MQTPTACTLRVVTIAIVAALFAFASRAHAETCTQIEVQNVHPDQGVLMIAAYADEASYGKTPITSVQMRVGSTATMTVPLCGLPAGTVAIQMYQDLNGNGQLDKNVFGLPTEPWGASGKPAPMAAPTWLATAVAVDGNAIVVKLSK